MKNKPCKRGIIKHRQACPRVVLESGGGRLKLSGIRQYINEFFACFAFCCETSSCAEKQHRRSYNDLVRSQEDVPKTSGPNISITFQLELV